MQKGRTLRLPGSLTCLESVSPVLDTSFFARESFGDWHHLPRRLTEASSQLLSEIAWESTRRDINAFLRLRLASPSKPDFFALCQLSILPTCALGLHEPTGARSRLHS